MVSIYLSYLKIFRENGDFLIISQRLILMMICIAASISNAQPLAINDEMNIEVEINGVQKDELSNVEAHLNLKQFTKSKHKEVSIRRWYKKGTLVIKKSLEALGYYNVEVQSVYQNDGDKVKIEFNIELNKQVTISEVMVAVLGEGGVDKAYLKIIEGFKRLQSKSLEHGEYEALKESLVNISIEKGYFDAKFIKKQIQVDVHKNIAKITVKYDSGKRYKFGEVGFAKSTLDEEFLQKFVPFSYGEYYDAKKLIKLRTRLLSSQYFEIVSVVRGVKSVNSLYWPIAVSYKLKLPHKYDYGLGYGTDFGPRISFGYQNRIYNARGQWYGFTAAFASKFQDAEFQYEFPDKDPLEDIYKLTAGYEHENLDYSRSTSFYTGIQRVHIKSNEWTRILYIKYTQDRFEVGSDSGKTSLLIPGISWIQSKYDDRIYPQKGWRGSIDVFGGLEKIGSEFSFAQIRTRYKLIRKIIPDWRLIMRAELGGTYIEDDDFIELPPSLRFFAGGDSSVRGYDYKSLSQRVDGEIVGSRHLIVGSVEVDYRISKGWGTAVFIDVGNAFESALDDLRIGRGFGVRWYSAVGPLRFDIAWPEAEQAKDFRLHLSIGPDL